MSIFDAGSEFWAKVVGVLGTTCLGIIFYFWFDPKFGLGLACGGAISIVIFWAARMDERPFWQHVFGRQVVYPENEKGQDSSFDSEP